MTIGGFASFLTAMGMLVSPVKRLTGVSSDLQRGLAAAESVFGLIDEQPEVDDGSLDIGRAEGRIDFEQVTFRYPGADKNAVEDFTLSVPPGETVALVGASGSGKSTIASLLPRFYDVTGGVIRLDGHDIRTLRLASLRANISMVSQDILLFNDTIAANIAYGCGREVTAAMIEQAARAAHALEFIEQLPEGFESRIGDKGVLLSGGQRQRLAIARAILKDAPLLILDEATSALDAESERHVQAALTALRSGRTTLVIAHRLSTIEAADRIVVLDHGRVVETGRHAGLLARGGAYARLYRSRAGQQAGGG
jgi:subfamily B ATP-binding cassette protein MsbA